ncbi:GNAT family N-acetyltransferase [Sphingopyxis lindanitolerans]|nr:GNAT family N-acetyltransferase [Sphingopyxis lindanitolerans]
MYHARFNPGAVTDAPSASVPSARMVDLAGAGDADWLAAEWERLEAGGRWPTQTHAFATALDPLLVGQQRRLFCVLRDSAIAALLPLCREPGWRARWRMAGSCELFEPGDLLCEEADDAAALTLALRTLDRPLSLDRIPVESPLLAVLRAAMAGHGWLSIRPGTPCPMIRLDAGWRDPESRFNAGRRSDFRRAARRAAALGQVRYETLAPSLAEFDALFDEAVGVEARSWKREAGSAIAVDRLRETFFRRFFRAAAARGNFRLSFLRIDGEAVAMQLALIWSGRYWLFKIGHDDRFGKCSPGTLLMLHALRWAAEQGLQSFELLGETETWITRFWTQDHHACVRVRTYPCTVAGMVAFVSDGCVWAVQRLRSRKR